VAAKSNYEIYKALSASLVWSGWGHCHKRFWLYFGSGDVSDANHFVYFVETEMSI